MSARTLSRLRLISISVLVLGLVAVAVAFSVKRASNNNLRRTRGYTLTMTEINIPLHPQQVNESEAAYARTVRYQKSDGSWKSVRTLMNLAGKTVKTDIGFGIPGEGVFRLDETSGSLEFISSMASRETTSYVRVDDGHNHPNFLRDDVVAGYRTYVLRFPDEDGGYTDAYLAPDLNNKPIRRITTSDEGIVVEDLVQVEEAEPTEDISLPSFPRSYRFFRQKIENEVRTGKPEIAAALKRQLKDELAKQRRLPQ